jgi:hypothetical protein
VKVAGAELDGVLDEAVYEHTDLETLGGHLGLEILNRVTHIKILLARRRVLNVSRTIWIIVRGGGRGKAKAKAELKGIPLRGESERLRSLPHALPVILC